MSHPERGAFVAADIEEDALTLSAGDSERPRAASHRSILCSSAPATKLWSRSVSFRKRYSATPG